MAGLKMDQEIQLENLDLFEYNGVYFPEKNYSNCDLIPVEWLELFESNKIDITDDIALTYTPRAGVSDLNFVKVAESFYDRALIT